MDRVGTMDFLLFSLGLPALIGALIFGSMQGSDSTGGGDPQGDGTADSLTGTDGEDVLLGHGGDDTLQALGGDDTVFAGTGADVVNGGLGDDSLYGNEGRDLISGGLGRDYIMGGEGEDTLLGGEGNDSLTGGAGYDRIFGGAGDDRVTIWPEAEGDYVQLGEGADVLDATVATAGLVALGGEGADLLLGGLGGDTLSGDTGADILNGGGGADSLTGGLGNDVVDGGLADGAADRLDGGAGDDLLRAGAGDMATGGDGTDRFVLQAGRLTEFAVAGSAVTIADFLPGTETIAVEYSGAAGLTVTVEAVAGGLMLRADGDDLAFLPGLVAGDLTAAEVALVWLGA